MVTLNLDTETGRSRRSQMFFKIVVLKNFTNFTEKHLCWSLFLIVIVIIIIIFFIQYMKLIIINKVDIDYMEMCRFPKFDFNLELFKSLLFFISRGTMFHIFGQRYLTAYKPQLTVFSDPN